MKQENKSIEAWKKEQEKLNEENDRFMKTLPEADRKKIQAVGEAMKILVENNVAVIMFAQVKHQDSKGREAAIQYNNWGELAVKNNYTEEESKDQISSIRQEFALAINEMMCQETVKVFGKLPKENILDHWFWASMSKEWKKKHLENKIAAEKSSTIPKQ